MADTNLPDKWVRKAIKLAVDGISVSGNVIKCYDVRATADPGNHYVLMGTQSNSPEFGKCGDGWLHSVVLDIITSYARNRGSRKLLDEITEAVVPLLNGLSLDAGSSMVVNTTTITFPGDLQDTTDVKTYYRKILRLEMYIT